MTPEELLQQVTQTEAALRELQQELAETNRGVAALALEYSKRLDEREAQLRAAATALQSSHDKLKTTETAVHLLQEELNETNRGLLALNLELEQRVDARTAELRQLNLELEHRVRERTAQLRQANENLQNFAHSAAHDLRSPLRAIANFSAIALEEHGPNLGAEGQFLLERVTQSAGQMRQLLDDLLEYSKISQTALKLEKLNLQESARQAVAMSEPDIRARNAIVTLEGTFPEALGHPPTVVLLINNYVSNALKFMPAGTQPQVRIRAEVRPQGVPPAAVAPELNAPGAVSNPPTEQPGQTGAMRTASAGSAPGSSASSSVSARSGPVVRLWVEDNGIGIEPKNLSKLFGVFQRLHSKESYPGTGLGLAIVRTGAERMGGAAGVESTPGHGSRFWFELPQA